MEKEEKNESAEGQVAAPAESGDTMPVEGGDGQAHPKNKKKLLILLILILAIIGGGSAALYIKNKRAQSATAAEKKQTALDNAHLPIFTDLNDMIINLNTEGKGVSFMKLKVTLEVKDKENLDVVKKLEPRIYDVLQVYLRELTPADVQGSVGIYRLRDEILLRINKVVYPATVEDVLFDNILVQ